MKQVDFEHGSITSNIIRTALPMLAAQLLHLLYSIVDRIYIGRIEGHGTAALGGIGLCFPMIILITAFTVLYGSGGAPLCSMERGRGDHGAAEDIMNTAFFLLCATSLILTLSGEIFAVPLLRLFGASGENMPYAVSYLRIYLIGTLSSMLSVGMNPYINAQGFSSVGMITVASGAFANILLDPLFIFVFHLGVEGAAIATILSQTLSAVYAVSFLRSPKAELRLRLWSVKEFLAHKNTAGSIISLGFASFIMQFTNSLVQVFCNSVLARTGGAAFISVMTIISSVRQIIDTPVSAITEGASPLISYNYGARKPQNIRRTIAILTGIALFYTFIMWLVIRIRPQFLIRIFSSDPKLMKDTVPAMRIYFSAFVFQALQYSGQIVFKSLNKKKRAIFFSLFRKVVMVIPLTVIFPYVFGMGTNGVFMAEPVSNLIGGSACFFTMLLTILPELKSMEQ